MLLLTKEIRERLPRLGQQDGKEDPVVHCKFFTPDSSWTWYVTEGEEQEDDFVFFGYVVGLEKEWGYFVLSELVSVRGALGLSVERDKFFEPGPFSQVVPEYHRHRIWR